MGQDSLIPMTVVAGYFGAGKTTWINHLIRQGLAPDTVILVNDFGEINIDASLIEYRDEGVIQLQNGCICCTLGGTLAETMTRLLRREPRPAAILVEASGISRPHPIANVARVSRSLRLEEIVCLVDCQSVEMRLADEASRELVTAQIRESDTLLLNKTGALAPEELQPIRAVLADLHPGARILPAPEGMTPPAEGAANRRLAVGRPRPAGHAGLVTFTVRCATVSSLPRLETLLSDYADVLVRAKGPVRASEAGTTARLLQFVNGRATLMATAYRIDETRLVCIGYEGPRLTELRAGLELLAG